MDGVDCNDDALWASDERENVPWKLETLDVLKRVCWGKEEDEKSWDTVGLVSHRTHIRSYEGIAY